MDNSQLLAIDNGTQSVRAIVFNTKGEEIAKCKQEIEAYFSQQPGWAEQRVEVYWQALCDVCQAVLADPRVDKTALRSVSLTTQRATVVNLDRHGQALRPAITWLDQRQADIQPMGGWFEKATSLIGERKTLDHFRRQAESNWLTQHEPDVWAKTDKFLLLSGYLTYRLTEQMADSSACQVGYIPFDYKRFRWAKRFNWKWKATEISPSMLPKLVAPTENLGNISASAAKATGIPEGLPLIAAGADKACEILGSGCMKPSTGALSFGTTATINTTSQRYLEVIPMIPPYPSAVPAHYCTEIQIFRGFWMVNWFKEQFGQQEQQLAEARGIAAEQILNEMIKDIPAGAMGLTLQPYWSPGVRVPGLEAKGAIIGFGDVHTRAHIYRAILEGLAYGLREGKELIERRTKTPINQLRVSGGGSQSDSAMQITADVFNLPAERPHTYETSGLGAVITAAVGLGIYPSFETAVHNMVRVGSRFEPEPSAVQIYEQLYREVYLKMYPRLSPLYRAIQSITGYPG